MKNDLLDRELVYDRPWVLGSGERLGPAREHAGVRELWENFEALAQGQSEA